MTKENVMKTLNDVKTLITNINLLDRTVFVMETGKSLEESLVGKKSISESFIGNKPLIISQETVDKLIAAMLTNAVASSNKDMTPDLIFKIYGEISSKISKKKE
ncbi:MAG: hypothetical protein CVT90_00325 [Candidatus Altiarchaeales archaeon HGW-Altiarchaeales-3]|nr:MAG: hypothetical protein CVT90_00325 [Candidatus Altiarchaeales archaeon HGW-Altiarchaeales-3]